MRCSDAPRWRRCGVPVVGSPGWRPATPTRCCCARPSTTASRRRRPARSATAGDMVLLHYVFGDQLGQYSGRIKRTPELEEMAHEFGEFKVVVVEVCPACSWNHMIMSYLLGDGKKRKPPRRQQTVEDIYG